MEMIILILLLSCAIAEVVVLIALLSRIAVKKQRWQMNIERELREYDISQALK